MRWRSNESLVELVQSLLGAHFRGLTNVAVDSSYRGHRLPSSDLECMARVWPKIERLYLNWSVRDSMDPTTSTPPVGALAHCARHYPALRTLVRLASCVCSCVRVEVGWEAVRCVEAAVGRARQCTVESRSLCDGTLSLCMPLS